MYHDDKQIEARLDENIPNGNHIGNILCGPESKAPNEEKDIKKHTHMTYKHGQWPSTPFGLNGLMESNGTCRRYVALQSHGRSHRRCTSECTHPQRSPRGKCHVASKWQGILPATYQTNNKNNNMSRAIQFDFYPQRRSC